MSKVVVGRPIDGITINEELEFILDEEGGVRIFDSPEQAKNVLKQDGFSDEDMEHITFLESVGTCFRCGSPLFKSSLPDYKYQCFSCDEDFYGFEQEGRE